jgi:tRNA/rRNA methyltransferase
LPLDYCRIVLVRPQYAGNIGSTARIMRNMGLTDLVLVAPEADPRERQARQLSTHGQDILDRARVVADIGSAMADCVLAVGTSARTGGLFRRQTVGTPETVVPHMLSALDSGPVALLFGPERMGLSNAEVACCHYLINIPTDSAYSSVNLAQAVTITLYELRKQWLARSLPPLSAPVPATCESLEHMFGQLRQALEEIHFLYEPKADPLMHALRHLLSRAMPSDMEVDLLRGLARQIRWHVQQTKGLRVGDDERSAREPNG